MKHDTYVILVNLWAAVIILLPDDEHIIVKVVCIVAYMIWFLALLLNSFTGESDK